MRLLILSDMHLEIWGDRSPPIDISTSRPDVVILAGDIHTKGRTPAWTEEMFPGIPVVYVAGNHEHYNSFIEKTGECIQLQRETYKNLHFLDCGEYVIGNVRFLGTTLWTDFLLFGEERKSAAMSKANEMMNDYRLIKVAAKGFIKMRAADTAELHAKQKKWLSQKLDEPFFGTTVVVTHMAPSIRSIPERYVTNSLAAAYASSLDNMVAKADLWVHGHVHTSLDYKIGKCRVVTNPRGYPTRDALENLAYRPDFIVEI